MGGVAGTAEPVQTIEGDEVLGASGEEGRVSSMGGTDDSEVPLTTKTHGHITLVHLPSPSVISRRWWREDICGWRSSGARV
jgi:hypothetical protein